VEGLQVVLFEMLQLLCWSLVTIFCLILFSYMSRKPKPDHGTCWQQG